MSQSGVRASKRDIRKAFGPATLQTLVDLEDAAKAHTEQIRMLHQRANCHGEVIGHHTDEIRSLQGFCLNGSFLGRLRWVFTGK